MQSIPEIADTHTIITVQGVLNAAALIGRPGNGVRRSWSAAILCIPARIILAASKLTANLFFDDTPVFRATSLLWKRRATPRESGSGRMKSTLSSGSALGRAGLSPHPRPGKIEIQATKPLGNQRDLALAYSPGVAAACEAIVDDPAEAAELTARQNLVAVITNGTAVLGLGDIGPLASKPVMEGKAVLFKKFAGIDCFDIEVDQKEIEKFVDVVAALEPTFGGINLEDIKGPECFEIEEKLKARMNIPVFHDDQHGTAIIVGAAILNGLDLAGKQIGNVKIVVSGAGAAALACLNLLVELGAKRQNIWVTDIDGVVHKGRTTLMDRWKEVFAQETEARTLNDVIGDADIFLSNT